MSYYRLTTDYEMVTHGIAGLECLRETMREAGTREGEIDLAELHIVLNEPMRAIVMDDNGPQTWHWTGDVWAEPRLEYLRRELRAESLSWSELADLQGLADYIQPGDVELAEAAGIPEDEFMERGR